MSCNDVSDLIQKQRSDLASQNASLDILSTKSPIDSVTASIHSSVSSSSADNLSQTPLGLLGKDFLAEQIAKNGQQIINNATGALTSQVNKIAGFDVRKSIQDAQKQIYNGIAAALTANNDLSLIFLQRVGQNAITAIDEKKTILLTLKEKVTRLHNALRVLVAGAPFFDKYVLKLREGLLKVNDAKVKVDSVKNTYIATGRFLANKFDSAKVDLEAAATIITPAKQTPNAALTNFGSTLLQAVGVPSSSEQLTVLIAVPQLAQECAFAATGYFIATLKVNALLLAFTTGYEKFTKSSSKLLDDYSISMLKSTSDKIGDMIQRMATDVNGTSTSIISSDYAKSPIGGTVQQVTDEFISVASGTNLQQVPLKKPSIPQVAPGSIVSLGQQLAIYRPDSIKVSLSAFTWVVELRSIIDYMSLVPGSTLANITVSNDALVRYNATVTYIKSKNNRTSGNAVLTATEGREDLGQLESQLSTFILKAVRAIVDTSIAANISALGRTILQRLDLSLAQDAEIRASLLGFVNTPVGLKSSLPGIAKSIKTALKNAGLDRAGDLLDGGKFDEFFNLNSKTATYAGAALVGIATLKACLTTSEDQEQLTQAERVIQREVKAKELLAQRGAVAGFLQQKATNNQQDQSLSTIQSKAQEACNKCGIPEDFKADALLKSVSNVLGVSSLGGVTLPNSLSNIGKGFL